MSNDLSETVDPSEAVLAMPPNVVKRIAYLGTPDIAVPPLRALHTAGFEIALVVSAPDRRRGRGSGLSPCPVKACALELGLPVTDSIDDLMELELDLAVVVAFGQIIRPPLLVKIPMINLHFSLLPRWRGAAPVERALLEGDPTTGVCVMAVEEGLDTGGIYRVVEVPIGPKATLETLRTELVEVGSQLLVQSLQEGLGEPQPQVGETVYAQKIQNDEYRISWNQAAVQIDRQIRLGRAWSLFRKKRLRIWEAELDERTDLAPGQIDGSAIGTAEGAISLVVVQPEGKPRMAASDWLNGAQLSSGEQVE